MRSIPIGVQSFIEFRESDLYYVDKTDLIDGILSDAGTKVFLYTRPRRFGKSLNLSMLDAYLNIDYTGNTWFNGLHVSEKRPNDSLKNSFPVVKIDLKGISSDEYEGFLDYMRVKITDLYVRFEYLLKSDMIPSVYKDRFDQVMRGKCTDSELSLSIRHLSEMLKMHHGVKTVVLIDEYDSPLNSTYGRKSHGKILEFLKNMLSDALKGNDALNFAVITGVMQISKESIFSGPNNISVNNIFSTRSDEMFGFTSDEIRNLCSDYGHLEKYEEARQWYDGYMFGNAEIYNPWSVLNYVKQDFRPDEYWAGTSGNSIIATLLNKADGSVFDDLRILGEGGSIARRIDAKISYADIEDLDGIYSVMVLSGYLKAVPSDDGYLLSIPNTEMFRVFGRMATDRFGSPVAVALDRFCSSLRRNDADGISKSLSSLLMSVLSSRVLDHEHSYQAFVAGMLLKLYGRYSLFADGERGKGYYDILLKSNRPCNPSIIIEFKRARANARDDTMRRISEAALQQIRDKEYFHGLTGDVLMYGIAVRGKDVVITSDSFR